MERKEREKSYFLDFSARRNLDVISRDGVFCLVFFRSLFPAQFSRRDGAERPGRGFGDAGSSRAPCHPVRAELRVAARRGGLAAQVPRAADPVGEGTSALQGPVR